MRRRVAVRMRGRVAVRMRGRVAVRMRGQVAVRLRGRIAALLAAGLVAGGALPVPAWGTPAGRASADGTAGAGQRGMRSTSDRARLRVDQVGYASGETKLA